MIAGGYLEGVSPFTVQGVSVSTAIHGERQSRSMRRATVVVLVCVFTFGCDGGESLVNAPKGEFGNGQETRDYVNSLNFTADSGLVGQYSCADPAQCPAGGVRLMFIPEKHAEQRNWKVDLKDGAAGDVVAQVVNVDTVPFPNLGLAPGAVAYAWVGQIGAGSTNRGFGVYRLDSAGFRAGTWNLVPKDSIEWCGNNAARSKPAIKDHHPGSGTCGPIQVAQVTGAKRLASLGISTAYAATARSASSVLAGMGQLWISCSGGCCQVKTN